MSSLSEIAGGADSETPQSYALRLCGYITDNGTVAMHVNRLFGTRITAARVAEIRATISAPRTTRRSNGLLPDDPGQVSRLDDNKRRDDAFCGSRDLARALWNYSGAQQ